jgi:undecaprenyl-diphosphatase
MYTEAILAVVQALTEFLPISSDGHLALVSNFFGNPDLFFITFLHLASLFAVIIFTRKEILEILRFNKESRRTIKFILIGIIPAAIVGLLFSDLIEQSLGSLLLLGFFFLFNGIIIFSTKFVKKSESNLTNKNVFVTGLMQALALLPGVSRSGMTISTGMFFEVNKEKAVKFSFLMFIPLALGAFLLEFVKHPNALSTFPVFTLVYSFVVCFILSLLCLNLLNYVIKSDKFWVFGIYCFLVSLLTFLSLIFGFKL